MICSQPKYCKLHISDDLSLLGRTGVSVQLSEWGLYGILTWMKTVAGCNDVNYIGSASLVSHCQELVSFPHHMHIWAQLSVCNKLHIPAYLLSSQIAAMQPSHMPLSDFLCALAPPDIHSELLWTNNNAVPLILQALLAAYRTQADTRLLHGTSVAAVPVGSAGYIIIIHTAHIDAWSICWAR